MSENKNLLIEIGTEELPPKALKTLAEAFADSLQKKLINLELSFNKINYFAAPRRLAVFVEELIARQPDRAVEKRGPALRAAFDEQGNPTQALQGFARSCNTTIEQLEKLETAQGSWMIYRFQEKGKLIQELLPSSVNQALSGLPIPKPMRWGDSEIQFVRPAHWIVMLYGNEIINGEILGIKTDQKTYGHRFHHPQAIELPDANVYAKLLEQQGFVITNFDKRKEIIYQQIQTIIKQKNCQAIINENLLNEVTGIVEWPVALLVNFDKEFLAIPREALISAMQEHQKCFALENSKHELLSCFITISNIQSKEPEEVIKGNERVMRARLSDAKFFFETDQKQKLASHLEGLKQVVFQAKLGSLYDKSLRISQLAKFIAQQINTDSNIAERAGLLCKTDLLTNMVGEFPELQGIMGYYYAKHDGEKDEVATAIRDHYRPRFAKDELPQSLAACCVALADRIDTLVGIFGINQSPTGDKDPFSLRRAALSILRIITEHKLKLDLSELLSIAKKNYQVTLSDKDSSQKILEFILDRLTAWYGEQAVGADTLQAVLATKQNNTKPFDIHQRVLALHQVRQQPDFIALAAANKRAANILNKEAKNLISKNNLFKTIKPALFENTAEQKLYDIISENINNLSSLNYQDALKQLSTLQTPVDHFFDNVMVMVENEQIRNNRLALLATLRQLFLQVADISLLQG